MRFLLRTLLRDRRPLPVAHEILKSQRWLGTSCRRLQEGIAAEPVAGGSSSSSGVISPGFLKEAYYCNQEWNKRLETPLIKKIHIDDFFFHIDQRYQQDKVISAIDVDLFVNKVTEEDNLEEVQELVHRLRKSPATADSLPSTSYALIRAFLNAGKFEDLMRILNDRWNYGVFVDHHIANILMDEFLKQGNPRDAAKVASLLMIEEDFGSPTSCYFAILSCLKYLENPEPWESSPPKEDSEEEVTKVRLYYIRNPFFDDHFDLTDPSHITGKILSVVSEELKQLKEDPAFSRSIKIIGLALHGKWDLLEILLQELVTNKTAVAGEAIAKALELCDKALIDIEASPNKTLPKPRVLQYPGSNLDEKDLNQMWEKLKYPAYEKFLPNVKSLLTSNKIPIQKDLNLIKKAQELLSSALGAREEKEIQEQHKCFQAWDERRAKELDNQLKRFRKHEVVESVEERKKELREKEEVIFFFDNEEEWMMRLPPDEQKGYKLSTQYIAKNSIPFVRSVPPKKEKRKKKT